LKPPLPLGAKARWPEAGKEHLNSGLARFTPAFDYNPMTAADEKVPLSVGHVNKKPLHLVFHAHFAYPLSKHRHLPVESREQACSKRVFVFKFAHFAPNPQQSPATKPAIQPTSA
jgi:hypothetical protein